MAPGSGDECHSWGGDVGKTTILEAIALLLHPTPAYALTDTDYWLRDVESEFVIEAVISLPEGTVTTQQYQMIWPWGWDGEKAVVPTDRGDGVGIPPEPVYVWRVRGTADMDLVYEVVQPNGKVEPLPPGARRSIGLLRLIGDDRSERELRHLHILLGSRELRGHLLRELAREDATKWLNDEAKKTLSVLESHFVERGLPNNLGLGITGGQGVSLNSLIALTAQKDGVALPLSSWGAGTRRLSALTIAKVIRAEPSVVLIDEIERALEPYRQRALVKELMASGSQSFITTHSPAVVAAASDASLWYMDARGKLGRLPRDKIRAHQQRDPETFLARVTVVCEGATEVGFMSAVLERTIGDYLDYGIWITDAGGNDQASALLDALADAGLTFAGVVDYEGRKSGTWSQIKNRLGELLIQWPSGCLEEHVIPLFDHDVLQDLIADPKNELTGQRLRTLAVRLGIEDTKWETIVSSAGDRLVRLIIDAAKGHVPEEIASEKRGEFKGHSKVWFKSVEGGRELADKVFRLGAWPRLKKDVLPFVNAIRKVVGLLPIEELPA